jgi:predicted Zn-dependent protease
MNSLADLNAILFTQIQKIQDEDATDEELEKEIKKSEAITKLSSQVLNSANIALQAQKQFDEYGTGRTVDIPLLGISNANLMVENKNLRRRLMAKEDKYD